MRNLYNRKRESYLSSTTSAVNGWSARIAGGEKNGAMIDLRPLLIAASVILAAVLLRRAFSSWIGGPSRTDEYHRLQTEQRQRDRESGNLPGEDLRCPECGSPMTRHDYPHLRVWRCTRYPDCRGFRKSQASGRPEFASDWERKHGGRARRGT